VISLDSGGWTPPLAKVNNDAVIVDNPMIQLKFIVTNLMIQ